MPYLIRLVELTALVGLLFVFRFVRLVVVLVGSLLITHDFRGQGELIPFRIELFFPLLSNFPRHLPDLFTLFFVAEL